MRGRRISRTSVYAAESEWNRPSQTWPTGSGFAPTPRLSTTVASRRSTAPARPAAHRAPGGRRADAGSAGGVTGGDVVVNTWRAPGGTAGDLVTVPALDKILG
ncbi:hypothetical protein GCM10010177_04720 [Actinomadura citrea]|nr:hypothetical protein GCM10010177_04720 [Actinomadura citrea]